MLRNRVREAKKNGHETALRMPENIQSSFVKGTTGPSKRREGRIYIMIQIFIFLSGGRVDLPEVGEDMDE